jgi:hypothetical protein
MIFSKNKWEEEREGLDYLKLSNACSWNTVKSPIRNAWDLFLTTLIGEAMAKTLSDIYQKDVQTDSDKKLIRLAQRANILLAFWYDYAELNVLIGDSGFKRQESEDTRTPYKYQEKQLRDGWKSKGFNALDDLLRFLENNISDYSDYAQSENYTQSRNAIIQNTAQVNEVYFINNSRLTYLRLKPHFKVVEDTIIAPRMSDLFQKMKISLADETPEEQFENLRKTLRPVIVYYGVHRLLLETGDLSDKGLFFAALKGDDSDAEIRPVSDERITLQAKQAETDAIAYWNLAENYIRKTFGIEPTSGSIPRRDNYHKRAFFA